MLAALVFTGAVICLANLLGLVLFATLVRRQLAQQDGSLASTRQDFQQAINQLLDRYQALRSQQDEDAEPSRESRDFQTFVTTSPSIAHFQSGMNLTKRVQILRLHRRGENTSHIASALGLPQTEVELVVKLHATTAAP